MTLLDEDWFILTFFCLLTTGLVAALDIGAQRLATSSPSRSAVAPHLASLLVHLLGAASSLPDLLVTFYFPTEAMLSHNFWHIPLLLCLAWNLWRIVAATCGTCGVGTGPAQRPPRSLALAATTVLPAALHAALFAATQLHYKFGPAGSALLSVGYLLPRALEDGEMVFRWWCWPRLGGGGDSGGGRQQPQRQRRRRRRLQWPDQLVRRPGAASVATVMFVCWRVQRIQDEIPGFALLFVGASAFLFSVLRSWEGDEGGPGGGGGGGGGAVGGSRSSGRNHGEGDDDDTASLLSRGGGERSRSD